MRSKKNISLFERMIKLHKDERGMTLVEVIIAITILTLVAVSVLHSLTTAMVYNKKARSRQEMTLTAESIMETFKGYDLDTLKDRFSGGTIGGVIGIEGVAYETVDGDSGYHYTATPLPFGSELADEYQFCIDDMKADDGQLYDVKITATPNSVEKIMVPDNMETTRDAIYKGDRSIDSSALQKAKEDFRNNQQSDLANYFAASYSDAVFKSGTDIITIKDEINKVFESAAGAFFAENYVKLHEKKLTIDIIDNGSGEYEVRPKMYYSYYMEGYPYYVRAEEESMPDDEYPDDEGGTPGPSVNAIVEHEPDTKIRYPASGFLEFEVSLSSSYPDGHFYKNPVEAGLDRLFVYYYPQYNLDPGCDTIVINNQANISNFQCYILKQRAPDINENQMKIKENGYKANIDISNSASGFKLFHNFDDNIADGSSTTPPSISGTYQKAVSYTKAGTSPDMTELMENFSEVDVLSYKLTLEVTQNGRTVTRLESSMNERINQ
ncbi:MAG: type II secretion system protein [Lachnospiraceae bacterium]|nr:type II secretion system protein [Lachnospiraceae bacterium]